MINIFLGLTPFIFITFLGYLFGRFKIFDLDHAKILNLFLFYIAVPALIIKLVAQSEIGLIDLKQIISYFLMQTACGILAYLITSKYFKRSVPESIIWALTVALSNLVFYEMMVFIGILILGIVYAWKKGVLQWK